MNYTFAQRFQVQPVDPDRLTDQCDRIMEALLDLENVADPSVGGAMTTGEVEISVLVDADSYLAAVGRAMAAIRTAIHAAEGGTRGWPRLDEAAVRSIRAEVAEIELQQAATKVSLEILADGAHALSQAFGQMVAALRLGR